MQRANAESGAGGCRRGGFTLVEIVVVLLIVGILAALAVPNLADTREEAHYATVGQDLRNLGGAQERYYQDHRAYAQALDPLEFTPSEGVLVDVIPQPNDQGWAAAATHEALDEATGCGLYLGEADPPPLPNGQQHGGEPGILECAR